MSLMVDATLISLLPSSAGWSEDLVPRFEQDRVPGGELLSGIRAARWHFRRWTGQTPAVARATLATWEALLRAPGVKTLSGYPVNGETVEAYVVPGSVRRSETSVTGLAGLSFIFEEATPVAPS